MRLKLTFRPHAQRIVDRLEIEFEPLTEHQLRPDPLHVQLIGLLLRVRVYLLGVVPSRSWRQRISDVTHVTDITCPSAQH